MKPKSCEYADPSNCVCYNKGDRDFQCHNQIANIVQELKHHKKDSQPYKNLIMKAKILKGDWFINSPQHNFCFWTWLQENHDKRHTLSECAELLGISISAIANLEKSALKKLKNSEELLSYFIRSNDFNDLN